jgi:hypothetical protein
LIDANIRKLADQLETRKWNLLLAGDAAGLASLSSTDMVYMHSSGLKDEQEQLIGSITRWNLFLSPD